MYVVLKFCIICIWILCHFLVNFRLQSFISGSILLNLFLLFCLFFRKCGSCCWNRNISNYWRVGRPWMRWPVFALSWRHFNTIWIGSISSRGTFYVALVVYWHLCQYVCNGTKNINSSCPISTLSYATWGHQYVVNWARSFILQLDVHVQPRRAPSCCTLDGNGQGIEERSDGPPSALPPTFHNVASTQVNIDGESTFEQRYEWLTPDMYHVHSVLTPCFFFPRLETLILQAVEQQRSQCAYHNTRSDSQVSTAGEAPDDAHSYLQVSRGSAECPLLAKECAPFRPFLVNFVILLY